MDQREGKLPPTQEGELQVNGSHSNEEVNEIKTECSEMNMATPNTRQVSDVDDTQKEDCGVQLHNKPEKLKRLRRIGSTMLSTGSSVISHIVFSVRQSKGFDGETVFDTKIPQALLLRLLRPRVLFHVLVSKSAAAFIPGQLSAHGVCSDVVTSLASRWFRRSEGQSSAKTRCEDEIKVAADEADLCRLDQVFDTALLWEYFIGPMEVATAQSSTTTVRLRC
eukprot:567398-Hanusia_phi.AAC.1